MHRKFRQELNILIHLKHPHIVPLVGICVNPLSIVLELAPVGALDQQLKHYRLLFLKNFLFSTKSVCEVLKISEILLDGLETSFQQKLFSS